MTRNLFGRYPRTFEDLHRIWEKYNWEKYNTNMPEQRFGQYVLDKYARRKWPALANMEDDWMAYSMISDIFK